MALGLPSPLFENPQRQVFFECNRALPGVSEPVSEDQRALRRLHVRVNPRRFVPTRPNFANS